MLKAIEVGQYIDLGFFIWQRADRGYYWDTEATNIDIFSGKKEAPEDFLLAHQHTTGYFQYKPLEEQPTLFLKFAALPGKKDAITAFANEFGLLTRGVSVTSPQYFFNEGDNHPAYKMSTMIYKNGEENSLIVKGEPLGLWRKEIRDMKILVQVWEWLKNGNIDELKLTINWKPEQHRVLYQLGTEDELRQYQASKENCQGLLFDVLASADIHPEILSRFRPGDVILPTQYLIQRKINEKLLEYRTTPRLLMDDKNRLRQYLMPENLLAAMWFQFYQAASGERIFKRCVICGLWADVTGNKTTWTRHPECANRERVKRSRKKKEG